MFLVWGHTGEYEDYHDWIVASFDTKQRAETWAKRANAWATERGLNGRPPGWPYDDEPENPYDEKMHVDYTGVHYRVRKMTAPHNPKLPAKA